MESTFHPSLQFYQAVVLLKLLLSLMQPSPNICECLRQLRKVQDVATSITVGG